MFRFQQKIMKHVKTKKMYAPLIRKLTKIVSVEVQTLDLLEKRLYCLIVKEVKGTMDKTKGHYANNASRMIDINKERNYKKGTKQEFWS